MYLGYDIVYVVEVGKIVVNGLVEGIIDFGVVEKGFRVVLFNYVLQM